MEEWDGKSFGGDKQAKRLADLKREYSISRVLRMLSGKDFVGGNNDAGWHGMPCPFHTDRKPSASINVGGGRFTCHSCGVNGDIFDVVQQVLGLQNLREAREWITTNG